MNTEIYMYNLDLIFQFHSIFVTKTKIGFIKTLFVIFQNKKYSMYVRIVKQDHRVSYVNSFRYIFPLSGSIVDACIKRYLHIVIPIVCVVYNILYMYNNSQCNPT